MDFTGEQISSIGRDVVKIAAVDRMTANMIYLAFMILTPLVLIAIVKIFFDIPDMSGLFFIVISIPYLFACLFLYKKIIFLFCRKKEFELEFDAEGFIFDIEEIKWADLRKITYGELTERTSSGYYRINIFYEQTWETAEGPKKQLAERKIADKYVLRMSAKEVAGIIADKFYSYYGALYGVKFKKIDHGEFDLKPVSKKGDIFQTSIVNGADDLNETPKIFR